MKKLKASLLPEGVDGELTRRYHAACALAEQSDEHIKAACDELLNIILTPVQEDVDFLQASDKEGLVSDNEGVPMTDVVIIKDVVEMEDPVKVKEAAVYALGEINGRQGNATAIQDMFEKVRPFFLTIPKAKTAKIVRNFIDMVSHIPNALEIQERLCVGTIHWCREEKRTFLRHRVETRLALLYHQLGRYTHGMDVINGLLQEVKRLDDKLLLVEIHYIEAKLYFSIRNIAKAKAALTAARSNANAIHCPPLLQADIDVMAGAIHCEDNDAKTAFSYFYEAFEAFSVADDPKATQALKYMMLSKLMSNRASDVLSMAVQRQYVKYTGRDTQAFKEIATSYQKRDLEMFKKTLEEFKHEISEDPVISRHTHQLYQTLLEQNILKVLKPFSRVEVAHVAELINLPLDKVHTKLSEMILDKQLSGTLDQGAGALVLFDEESIPTVYTDGLAVFENLSSVVDLLYKHSHTVL